MKRSHCLIVACLAGMSLLPHIGSAAAQSGTRVPDTVAAASVPPPEPVWRAIFARPAVHPGGAVEAGVAARIALGRALFQDPRLSGDGKRTCATCHQPARAFTDGRRKGRGRDGNDLRRNTPTLYNLAWARSFYWDGRMPSLEAQARAPITHPNEMGGDLPTAAQASRRDPVMAAKFAKAFPTAGVPTPETILEALAAYEKSLVSPLTGFDRWIAGDARALTSRAYAGFRIFTGKAGCLACHGGWRFTDDRFHDIGLSGSDDLGRGSLPGAGPPVPAFKTPGLRAVGTTAPYMHDGRFATLAEVIRHYEMDRVQRPSLAVQMRQRFRLTQQERDALIAFLRTL